MQKLQAFYFERIYQHRVYDFIGMTYLLNLSVNEGVSGSRKKEIEIISGLKS